MPVLLRTGAIAFLASVALLCSAPAVDAKVPDPRFSRVSQTLVGTVSGDAVPTVVTFRGGDAPARVLGFRVEAHDLNNAPLWYKEVTLDFSGTSIRLLADDRTGTTVDCAARTIRRFTGQDGVATFQPRFCGTSAGSRVIVSVEGVTLRELEATSTDLDGDGIVGLADFARFGRNFHECSTDPATDFDACEGGTAGRTTLADFAVFARELQHGAHGTACP